jgi:predicted transport protein
MSDIKLFRLDKGGASELSGSALAIEKTLQDLIERNLEAMLGVRFVASEHSTGKVHGGRIDTLGIDENGSPVIVEFKRASNENVINQGLFYLDWLLDHRAEFTLLAMKKLGSDVEEKIDWSAPRLVCIAGDFTRYDEHAVSQIGRNIELYRYRSYEEGFFILELVNSATAPKVSTPSTGGSVSKAKYPHKTVSEFLDDASPELRELYELLDAYLLALGDDVSKKTTAAYLAYRRIKNFACVTVHPQSGQLPIFLKVSPNEVELEEGFTRDVSEIGHFGTGDLEVRISSLTDLERAKPLIERSYDAS